MSKPVRVRFAPSPTGPLHIGGVRTALFNYLFAKKHGGVFYLRVEDTDQNRFVPGAEQYIFEALDWLGISPSETVGRNEKFGPYRQSERKLLYRQYSDALIASGNAYYAFDTAEALDNHRKDHEEKGKTFIYNHHNREKLDNSLRLSADEIAKRISSGEPYVVRFKTPVDETLQLHDIIRGEEWLPSMPLHVLLYRAFGWDAPEFAHLPLILKPIGNGKLSKRDGDKLGFPVFPLEWKNDEGISSGYREKGYFPEAVVNFLALLGWNDGTDKELFSLDELVDAFDLNRVHKAGAKFDPEKNKWFNHQYLIRRDNESLANDFAKILNAKGIEKPFEYVVRVVSLIKERAHFVSEFWELGDYFFTAPTTYDEKAAKNWKDDTSGIMSDLIDVLESVENFTSAEIETKVKDWMTANEIGMGKVMQPFRLSVVGALKGPHLFDIVEMIGIEETVHRIKHAIANL